MAKPRKGLAARRKAMGYSQESLAERLRVTPGTVGRWEQGKSNPEAWLQPHLAKVLDVSVQELIDLLNPRADERVEARSIGSRSDQPGHDPRRAVQNSYSLDSVHGVVPLVRRALDAFDLPDDGPTRPLIEIAADVARVNEHRLEARYGALAEVLPDLLAELARAAQVARPGLQEQQVALLRALALRAADGIAFKFGYLDLSSRLIDLMRQSAAQANDPLLVAAAEYVRTETFFASGDLSTAGHALVKAASESALSNLDDQHVAFGPQSIRIHELAVATELRDPIGIERAATWHPSAELPAERRSHYYIELSSAQHDLGHHEEAYVCIEMARDAAPQHTREHPQVKGTLASLLQHRPGNNRVVELAAWAGARAI
ncbi:helix-turn-helix domain-containing protein [Lentzea sp. NEAU-D7]|uniref:helix-turn-helix domain-containing protein n=1 Tax=Lentzea sp. NEAU-D7 TaxID=2994667 RepID=UPI00224AB888|nr:helix-turn-helix domain-containing protein [Lentzea sp. NEAU-D7]MCX2948993.1 helix-turn-helix domain-containing protein [Lentzea sp. NEAU-D7]